MQKFYGIVTILVFFFLSKGCISDYIKGGDTRAISNYEQMLFDSSTATAELSNEYKEITAKVLGVRVKTYEFRYKFWVGSMSYNGGHTFSDLPKGNTIQIWYLKSDPNVSCIDPAGRLAIEKEKNTSKSDLYWGIGFGVACFLTIVGFIKELRTKKEEPAAA